MKQLNNVHVYMSNLQKIKMRLLGVLYIFLFFALIHCLHPNTVKKFCFSVEFFLFFSLATAIMLKYMKFRMMKLSDHSKLSMFSSFGIFSLYRFFSCNFLL